MSPLVWAAAAGMLVAGGLLLVGYGLAPVYPALGDALRRLDPAAARQLAHPGGPDGADWADWADWDDTDPDNTDPDGATGPGWQQRAQTHLAGRLAQHRWVTIPRADLNLLGRSVESFLIAKVGWAAAGLLFFPALAGLLAVLGLTLPLAIPAAASIAGAVGGFFLPDSDTKNRATRARLEMRQALCAYLDLAALARAANYGAVDALTHAAATGHGWTFARIREALSWAERHQAPPWGGLQRLAEQADIVELADVAAISRGGSAGAAVFGTLLARSASLRSALLAEAHTRANKASEKMTLPVVAIAFGFLALVLFAALARVIGVGA